MSLPLPEVVQNFTFGPQRNPGIQQKYDWDRLCNGQIYVLRRGVNFTTSPESVAQGFRKQCQRRELVCNVCVDRQNGTVHIQAARAMTEEEKTRLRQKEGRRQAIKKAAKQADKDLVGTLMKALAKNAE